MASRKSSRRPRVARTVVLCVLAVCLVAVLTLVGLINRRLSALQQGAAFEFSYQATSTAAQTPALYSVLEQLNAVDGTVRGQYAPGKLQLSLYLQRDLNANASAAPFTHLYIDQNETLFDAGQLYASLRSSIVQEYPLANALLPAWSLGDYISQTQLSTLLGTAPASVEMQSFTGFTLAPNMLKKASPQNAKDGYTYFRLASDSADAPTLILGLPLRELLSDTLPLHVLIQNPAHGVALELSGTLTAAQTTIVAPSSRMKDEDVAVFAQIRQTLENIVQILQGAA